MLNAIYDALQYIEEHLNEEIKIVEVANSVGYSQFYFSRLFSKHLKQSVYDYIIRRKLTEARQYIVRGNKVVDAAFRYGFNSHENFSRCFKKMYSISPRTSLSQMNIIDQKSISMTYLKYLSALTLSETHKSVALSLELDDNAENDLISINKDHMIQNSTKVRGTTSPTKLTFTQVEFDLLISISSNDLYHSRQFFFNQVENQAGIYYFEIDKNKIHVYKKQD